eukprot:3070425-Prymnesium_polylepis.1
MRALGRPGRPLCWPGARVARCAPWRREGRRWGVRGARRRHGRQHDAPAHAGADGRAERGALRAADAQQQLGPAERHCHLSQQQPARAHELAVRLGRGGARPHKAGADGRIAAARLRRVVERHFVEL